MHQPNIRVSGALNALAPKLANDIAALLPFPHQPFFELPPARMHLLGTLIIGADPDTIDLDRLRARKWQDAASMLADPLPGGLEGVLSAMTLPMWSPEDYQALLAVIPCPKAMTVLRHARDVTPTLVGVLRELPSVLRVSKICRQVQLPIEARVIARMCERPEVASLLLASVAASDNQERFYEKLKSAVRKSDVFPAPPEISDEMVKPVLDLDQLRRIASEFGNCLRAYADQIAAGSIAFYVVEGDEPAVVSVKPLIGGRLTIDEMKGVGNVRLSIATERRIRRLFGAHGVVKGAADRRRELVEECLSSLCATSIKPEDDVYSACRTFLEAVG